MISNSRLLNALKFSGLIGPLVTILTFLFAAYGFYYKTTETQKKQDEKITVVQEDVKEIKALVNKNEVFQGVSTVEYNALKEKVNGIEKTVDKIDNKLDRIIEQTRK
jgi:H+/gluconate symporter-like permease